jgi:hypothetical protein
MRLLADDELLPFAATANCAADSVQPDLLNDAECGPMLRVYVALTNGSLGADLSPEDRLYNRYFWFRRFANAHRAKFGRDEGIEQLAFQILEHSNCDVDWTCVEQLVVAARPIN